MLRKIEQYKGYAGPIAVIVMDGVGLSDNEVGNCVRQANTPTLDRIMAQYPTLKLKAHGKAVGMPSDADMGNSEVGHNAMGAGKVYHQGAMLVNEAIESGSIFRNPVWKEMVDSCIANSSPTDSSMPKSGTLHFIGLFSDGNVHSHIDHLKAMIIRAKADGVKTVRIHILLDGRDVGETSALDYVEPFEDFLTALNDEGIFSARIASGGGRMYITMDRYGADWSMVERGWNTHVHAQGRGFPSARDAISTYRAECHCIDQDLREFVIVDGDEPVGPIRDGDSVVYFNFRGDRAIEISQAFEMGSDFDKFDRGVRPKVLYAGMLEYDGDAHIPKRFLVNPPEIKNTLGELLCAEGVRQLALSETQKFGHVTYFWNGNRSGKFSEELETYIEIPSDVIPFEQRPWMKAAEITDALIAQLREGRYDFVRVNFPNGDMVGHTGSMPATRIAIETVDLCLARILPVLDELGGMAIITADHGNADEMLEFNAKSGQPVTDENGNVMAKTSHTLNKVPCIFYDNSDRDAYEVAAGDFGLSNIASTVANLLGFESPDFWDESMIRVTRK